MSVRLTIFVLLSGLLSMSRALAAAADAPSAPPGPVVITVTLEVASKSALDVKDVRLAVFPGGKRCAFTYEGATKPKTIALLQKLGFRTTVFVGPASAELARGMEDAGAEIAVSPWGCKGAYASSTARNNMQEHFDLAVTSRLALRRSVRGPVLMCAWGGHISPTSSPLNRDMDAGMGYAAAFHDANYLALYDFGHPFMIYTGHQAGHPLIVRDKFDSAVDKSKMSQVPNELIYYQILAGQFEGTLKSARMGQVCKFLLRDFADKDMEEAAGIIGKYGSHPLVWHATRGEIAAYAQLQRKARVTAVRAPSDGEVELSIALDRDIFPGHLLAPLSLLLPSSMAVKSARAGGLPCGIVPVAAAPNEDDDERSADTGGTCIDVPLAAMLQNGCEMALETSAPGMAIPSEMGLKLTIRNTSNKKMENARLEWVGVAGPRGGEGLLIAGEQTVFDIEPGASRTVGATARATRGAPWGLAPAGAIVRAGVGGEARVFMAGFEIAIAPRLRADILPMNRIGMAPGSVQHFVVTLDNLRGASPGGPADTFISHAAGPCKGTLSFALPEGMEAQPAEQTFDLAADARKSFVFKIKNNAWSKEPGFVRPVVVFAGEKEPSELICMGTKIVRDRELLEFKPLDGQGLLACASWDDKDGRGALDRCCGAKGANTFGVENANGTGMGVIYSNEGAKSWCVTSRSGLLYQSFKNIDYREGTVLFWIKRDPQVKNENQYRGKPEETAKVQVSYENNYGETVFAAGMVQLTSQSNGGLTLRRYPGWDGKDGYLQATYQGLGHQLICAQAAFETARQWDWRHVAVAWSMKDRRLEIYLDGKLAAKAEPGEGEWLGVPWDNAGGAYGLQTLSMDHGKWCGTNRDEWYTYNRALSADEIKANMERVRK